MQYLRNDLEFSRGDSGCVVTRLFPAENSETAVRVELFDGDVEEIILLILLPAKKKARLGG